MLLPQLNSNFAIKFISASECYDLRSRILRPGQPIENIQYAGDFADSSFHVGIVDLQTQKIVCNGTFMPDGHELFAQAEKPFRLRGMATDLSFQKQNLGSHLLQFALVHLNKINCDLLWFNARTSALNFYVKNGFNETPEVFEIAGAGPHIVMFKWLRPS